MDELSKSINKLISDIITAINASGLPGPVVDLVLQNIDMQVKQAEHAQHAQQNPKDGDADGTDDHS